MTTWEELLTRDPVHKPRLAAALREPDPFDTEESE